MKTYHYKELFEGVKINNAQAAASLYKRLLKDTGNVIRTHVIGNQGVTEDAEDLLNESFFQLVIRIKDGRFSYRYDQALFAFFIKLGKGLWRDQFKKNQRENSDIADVPSIADTTCFLQQLENKDFVENLLLKLGKECRKLLILSYWYGMKAPEIMEEMSFESERKVHDKKYDCMQKLRK